MPRAPSRPPLSHRQVVKSTGGRKDGTSNQVIVFAVDRSCPIGVCEASQPLSPSLPLICFVFGKDTIILWLAQPAGNATIEIIPREGGKCNPSNMINFVPSLPPEGTTTRSHRKLMA
ncbi:unnamed protein product, partial [Musa acuminata subsp. burmannicoides]